MPQAHKLRLGDGSVIQLDRADMRSWYERGLIGPDTPVQRPGSSRWTRLAEVENVRGWRAAGGGSARVPARRQRGGSARRTFPSPWPRRLLLGTAALLAVAAVGFSWDVWLPWLRQLLPRSEGSAARSAPLEDPVARRRREALQAAAAELPHLDGPTITLVMASSAAGVLDPPEVFRRSYEAAGRGLGALAAAEAQELAALNSALSAPLTPRQRAQLADYIERVRGKRPTSPSEDAEMSRVVRRGVSALSPARRARLQALLGKAVASALAAPPPAAQLPAEAGSAAETR